MKLVDKTIIVILCRVSDCEELVGVTWRLSDCEELVGLPDRRDVDPWRSIHAQIHPFDGNNQ